MIRLGIAERTKVSLYLNLAFATFHSAIGFYDFSWWMITLGAYYSVLSVMKFSVIKCGRETQDFAKRFTGVMLIVLSVCLVGMIIMSAVKDRGREYHEIVMITIAAYAFTKMTLAVINLVKSGKQGSQRIKTLRNISFANALVSILSLQRSMLVSFPGMAQNDIVLMNTLTGTAVCILVLMLGINLKGGRRVNMAKSKLVKANEKITEKVVDGYKKVEKGVVDGYKSVENAVVGTYEKLEDKFVDKYLTKDGETVEEAKKRLKNQDK